MLERIYNGTAQATDMNGSKINLGHRLKNHDSKKVFRVDSNVLNVLIGLFNTSHTAHYKHLEIVA